MNNRKEYIEYNNSKAFEFRFATKTIGTLQKTKNQILRSHFSPFQL